MNDQILLLLPNQLFKKKYFPILKPKIILFEHEKFFSKFNFHKYKIVLHRSSILAYKAYLEKNKFIVDHLDNDKLNTTLELIKFLKKSNLTTIHYFDTIDHSLQSEINNYSGKFNLNFIKHESPMFLNSSVDLDEYFKNKKKYLMNSFYIGQRKKLKILVNNDSKPIGSRWSFDKFNRKKLPRNAQLPEIPIFKKNEFVESAKLYAEKKFSRNPGQSENFFYPISYNEFDKWLNNFFKFRLNKFGDYEDAILSKNQFIYHSIISYALNIGLITPDELLKKLSNFVKSHKIPINSLEGFIRQIIGWREFVRGVYLHSYQNQISLNFFKFDKKIPNSFWNGSTGIDPVDDCIKKILSCGYTHHIERLMILGNFMLLCQFDPKEVYKWFMELFVDSYEWVMMPNVYGMSQYSDGGIMITKPYISSSNYILKMSDYKKGKWSDTWDALYWNFINQNREVFLNNPRSKLIVLLFDKKENSKKMELIKRAENFLCKLY